VRQQPRAARAHRLRPQRGHAPPPGLLYRPGRAGKPLPRPVGTQKREIGGGMMETVSFTRMEDGTVEDYALLDRLEKKHVARLPDRILAALRGLEHSLEGYRISRLEHSLQAATRAEADGADIELVVAALIHDLGDD